MQVKLSTLNIGDRFTLSEVNMGIVQLNGDVYVLDEKNFYFRDSRREYYACHRVGNEDVKHVLNPDGNVERCE